MNGCSIHLRCYSCGFGHVLYGNISDYWCSCGAKLLIGGAIVHLSSNHKPERVADETQPFIIAVLDKQRERQLLLLC